MSDIQQLPGLRRRIASMAYECLLLLGVLSVTFVVPHVLLGMTLGVSAPPWVLLLNFFGVIAAYFLWYWRQHGQTLAMQTWQLQLVREHGGQPSLPQLLLRCLLAWALPLLMIFVLSRALFALDRPVSHWYPYVGGLVCFVWALFDRDRQFLHDRLAGTRIVFKAPPSRSNDTNTGP